jgi:hypothetical protein
MSDVSCFVYKRRLSVLFTTSFVCLSYLIQNIQQANEYNCHLNARLLLEAMDTEFAHAPEKFVFDRMFHPSLGATHVPHCPNLWSDNAQSPRIRKILDASFYAFADATLVQTIGADNVWTRDHRVLRAACALFGSAPTRCPNPISC